MNSKEYWNRKIINWENASYEGDTKGLNFIEKLATKFRSPIKIRREILLRLLKDSIKGKSILELGCGSGDLCFSLLELGADRVIGIDIADEAITAAKKKASKLNFENKTEFYAMDIRDMTELPDADFVIGLGFIDYIDAEDLKKLFTNIKGRFVFSFPEKKWNLINILHYLYLLSQGCPSFYKFSQKIFLMFPL